MPPARRTGFVQRTRLCPAVREEACLPGWRKLLNYTAARHRASCRTPLPDSRPVRATIAPRFSPRLVKAQKIHYAALSYPHPTAAPSGSAAG
ncbi:hypothetical protein BVIET440_110115 [Burkholderia vietnamiensis]|nr:hypothetical protein BVI2075_1360006 [Burkholderia vietnamiensis]